MSRFIAVLTLGVAMLGLVVFSQFRTSPNYVSGIIEAEEIRLGSRVAGRVRKVHVKEGEVISAGQALVEFEPYDLLEREKQAAEQLAEAEAVLKKLRAGYRSEEIAQAKSRYEEAEAQLSLVEEGPRKEEIAAAQRRLEAAEANLKLANREYERQTELLQRNAAAQSEFDAAEERFEAATANVKVRENELEILRAGSRDQEIQMAQARVENLRLAWELAKLGFRDEEIEQAAAARDAAQAALEAIGKQRDELTIISPCAGSVDSLDLQPGDLVAPNAPVMTLLSQNALWVRAYVPQRLMQIRVGQKLRVTVDSFPDQDFIGELTYIAQQAEFTPSNVQTPDDRAKQVYRIRATLSNRDDQLRPGMTANVWLAPTDGPNE